MDGEERIAQESQRTDEIGISASSMVFAKASIFTPVEAIFHSSPVAPNRTDPLFWSSGVGDPIADVIPLFLKGHALAGAEVMDANRTTGMGEVDG